MKDICQCKRSDKINVNFRGNGQGTNSVQISQALTKHRKDSPKFNTLLKPLSLNPPAQNIDAALKQDNENRKLSR